MKKRVKIKGKLSGYFNAPLRLGLFMVLANILIYFISWPAGIVLTVFLVIYFAVTVSQLLNSRVLLLNEMVSFATEYGQVQKKLLKELDLPYAILDDTGRVIWINQAFDRVVHGEKILRKPVSSVFPSITKDSLPATDEDVKLQVDYESSNYRVEMKRIPLDQMEEDSDIVEAAGYEDALIALYLFDETAVRLAIQEVDDQSVVIGFIYMDNYEEALDSVEDVRRSLLTALIDRKVNKYISSIDGICSKIEKDKYLIILRKKSLRQLQEAHFELLSDVKTVNIGNEMAITLSIGIGMDGLTYAQNYEFARNAIDLALGRGGDQAVIKHINKTEYYGGKLQSVEKRNKGKSRIVGHALTLLISQASRIFIMGHRYTDMDSFGAALGIARLCMVNGKNPYIVIENPNESLEDLLSQARDSGKYNLIGCERAISMCEKDSLVIVVDTHRPDIVQCPELLKISEKQVVIDHHRKMEPSIEFPLLNYMESYASSASELVTEMLEYMLPRREMDKLEAEALLAGIIVDTNYFSSRTGVRTFEAAAWLRRQGADPTEVKRFFQEAPDYARMKGKALSEAVIMGNGIALASFDEKRGDAQLLCAQLADRLLSLKGIRASFACGRNMDRRTVISARSLGDVNVQVIMEKMGGGGHLNNAGAQVDLSVEGAIKKIMEITEESNV